MTAAQLEPPTVKRALDYADQALAVLPLHSVVDGRCTCGKPACKKRGKHPRTKHGVKDASSDPDTIVGWWATWPDANVGIATGKRSGIVALDVDKEGGGDASLAALEGRHGRLPETVESRTGGGGRHILFLSPSRPVPSSAGALGAGLDVRGDGGYIVAPPSVHKSGREYAWDPARTLGRAPIAPLPSWLLGLLARPGADRRSGEGPSETRARFRWEDVLDGVRRGRRHMSIFLMTSSLRGQATPETVAQTLALHAAGNCTPPLRADEALAIVRDVYRRYPTNADRRRAPSPQRIDVLAVLWTALRPLKPARVAEILGRPRDRVKKLMGDMHRDGQLDRSDLGYRPIIAAR